MRVAIFALAVIAGLIPVAGCSSTGANNAAAVNAMDNPPNSCGPGGKSDVVDCPDGA